MTRSRSPIRRYGADALVCVLMVVGVLDGLLRGGSGVPPTSPGWFTAAATALVVLPLLGRRRFPFAAPAAVWLAAGAVSFVDGQLIDFAVGLTFAGLVAAFLLGQLPEPRQARVGLAVVIGAASVIVFHDPDHTPAQFLFTPTLFVVGWLAGYAVRERSARMRAAESRAEVAERERDARARLAVAEERARIARELHDVVAHSVSVMVLQVGAVRHRLAPDHPVEADALRDVEGAGRSALVEMRRLLGGLREDGEEPALAPQPGLDQLPGLATRVRGAGLPVDVVVEGEPVPLPPAIDLSAYRIVQEGLTNALKHAGASRVQVTLAYAPDELRIEIRDDGRNASTESVVPAGHGLLGIGERVKIFGGEMSAAPGADGGYLLSTRLPLAMA